MANRKPIVENSGAFERLQSADDVDFASRSALGLKSARFDAEYDAGNSGSSVSIDWANGAFQKLTLNAATPAITIGTPAGVGRFQLKLIQDASGNRNPTWAGSAYSASRWIGSTAAPTINTAISGVTIVSFFFDGTNLYQAVGQVGVASSGSSPPSSSPGGFARSMMLMGG